MLKSALQRKRIAVTGAGGFIGRHVAMALHASGHEVVGCVRRPDVALSKQMPLWVESLPNECLACRLKEFQPDLLVHCAGSSHVGRSFENPPADFEQNVSLTHFLYETLARVSPRTHTILLSSAAVYGQPAALPITEATPAVPLSPYGFHKYLAEVTAQQWHQEAGLSTLILRVFSAYGPGLRKQVLFDIFQKSRAGNVIELAGNGTEQRDFVHVSDLVRAISWAIENQPAGYDLLNFASGHSITIRELAQRFLSELNWRGTLRFNRINPQGMPRCWRVAPTRLRALDLMPQIGLEEGLGEYAKWLLTQEGAPDETGIVAAAG
ncbi:MAG: NAD-dependent epimerase/dehydratase family protein [Planctomycetota bacterium]